MNQLFNQGYPNISSMPSAQEGRIPNNVFWNEQTKAWQIDPSKTEFVELNPNGNPTGSVNGQATEGMVWDDNLGQWVPVGYDRQKKMMEYLQQNMGKKDSGKKFEGMSSGIGSLIGGGLGAMGMGGGGGMGGMMGGMLGGI